VLATRLYEGKQSRIIVEGVAGPVSAAAIPVEAKLNAALVPAEIPAAVRKEHFGELLTDPGSGRVSLEAALKGDVYGTLAGSAKLAVAAMPVGPEGGKLPLAGETPATFTLQRLTSTPVIQARVRGASLRLGSGRWNGGVDLISAGGVVRGSSTGALSGVDINQFLSAFASSPGKMSGTLAIPSYSLRFGGKNAVQIKNSLAAQGRLEVTKGQVKMLDLLGSIRRALEGRGREATAEGETAFSTLTTDLRVSDRQLLLSELALSGPALTAAGEGAIGFDQSLAFRLRVLVAGRIAELLGSRPVEGKAAEGTLPVVVSGTVASPSVRPAVASIAVGAAKGFFQDFLKRQLGKKREEKQ
jgi:hypothetical protein